MFSDPKTSFSSFSFDSQTLLWFYELWIGLCFVRTSSGWTSAMTPHLELSLLPLTVLVTTGAANDRHHSSHHDNWWMDRYLSCSMWFCCMSCPVSSARLWVMRCSYRVWWSRRTCQRRTALSHPGGCKRLQRSVPNVLSHRVHLSTLQRKERGRRVSTLLASEKLARRKNRLKFAKNYERVLNCA